MEIDIWPEYDQPATLVIYRISFTSLTSFPAKVSFKIPSSAGDPYSVAMKDLDGLLYDLEYTIVPDGNWNRIEFITSTPDVQLEFYDPILHSSAANHTYSFRWISDYAINQLKVVVQKPKYAATMKIQPDFGEGVVNEDDGLTYYTANVGSVDLSQTVSVNLSYLKTNNELSASTLPVRAVSSTPQKTNTFKTLTALFKPVWENRSLLIAGGFLFAGILLFLIVLLLSSRRKSRQLDALEQKKGTENEKSRLNSSESREVYCHVCGKRARPGDVFCRACGSKLIQN